jgi:hypothetical protein
MINLSLDTVVRRNPDIVATEAGGELLMMDINSDKYYGLNEVASFIWERLAEPHSVSAVCDAIHEAFDVDKTICSQHALMFIEDMIKDGLAEAISSKNKDFDGRP